MENDLRLAVLIDAENFSSKYVRQLFDEIADEGHATIRRVYGGWNVPQLRPWKKVLETYSISTKQECCYSYGKSASDSAMIIDAMDILYSGAVDGFCIASSDGDFTNLARRIREAGKLILGAGENKTPKAFVNSCNKFIYVDLLEGDEEELPAIKPEPLHEEPPIEDAPVEDAPVEDGRIAEVTGPTPLHAIKEDILRYFASKSSNGMDRRVNLSAVGGYLCKKHPDFDCRNYKCRSLVQLVKTFEEFELEFVPSEKDPKAKAIYVTCLRQEAE